MNEFLPWLFDGIGSELLSLIIGGLIGGCTVHKLNCRQNIKIYQKAKDSAQQINIGEINVSNNIDT